ncbi:hypothetical protein [Allocoleopsis franciscana]|uniref:Uncharacterized protein n=1 Tax=Allocoleopsis franciscana PCC 7113 TaxID=1173027 RepID=K9WD90_9CYAN|nr:hypothetical protein [Allocoleopsis franciscana]AFZ18183.1 hypothetical protein Mic7113_2379 [Allocoleopsis franciscana PCC 7113]
MLKSNPGENIKNFSIPQSLIITLMPKVTQFLITILSEITISSLLLSLVQTTAIAQEQSRTFDSYAWLTTHNAFANYEDSRWSVAYQSHSIDKQLRNGVRAFMLDAHYFEGTNWWICRLSLGYDCYDPGVYLCHGNPGACLTFAGGTYALPRQTFHEAVQTIVNFLKENPKEVVTIFLEDYTSKEQLESSLNKVSNLNDVIYDLSSGWKVTERGWPSLKWMQDNNKRLIIYTKQQNVIPGKTAHTYDFIVENYWSIGSIAENYNKCDKRGESKPYNTKFTWGAPLFTMNHFRDVPSTITAAIDNNYNNLLNRVDNVCSPSAGGKRPNFIAVDFYELPAGYDRALQVVQEINRRFSSLNSNYIQAKYGTNKCIHKQHDGWGNGNPIHIWDCDVGPEENKSWEYDSNTGYIKNRLNRNKCLHKQHDG